MKVNQASQSRKPAGSGDIVRLVVSIRGIVQGVGFRPFVYQLASKHALKGWVVNTSEGVEIDIEGRKAALDSFISDLKVQSPPRASIEDILVADRPLAGYRDFEIRQSVSIEGQYQLVSPDIATCPACLDEFLAPDDRRYLYPFTNCTNCGPRFTIIEDIPYDRPKTTMRGFIMCPQCQQEYDDPLNRRFHAQPNACPVCGPHVQLIDGDGKLVSEANALTMTSQLLREGYIIAIKGLGGFLIACDATNDESVQLLRARKIRPSKPLAVMLTTIKDVKKHCHVSPTEEMLLTSPQCPIVLLSRKDKSTISSVVAPYLNYFGVMLPYTPLHHILCRKTDLPLVMTSGNLSEEPIAKDNDEACHRLGNIVDYFLIHNRGIYTRYDDSVVMVEGDKPQVIRRARGYAPYPIHLTFKAKQVLACGAEMKNTFCLTRDRYAFLSQHIGDMENMETLEHFETTIELYKDMFRIEPEIIAYDMHPDYLATKYARDLTADNQRLVDVPVQHHHAHIISCLVDNGFKGPAIGVAFDGTGYGTDGNIWGGEFIVVDGDRFDRLGHLQYIPLPGGDAGTKKPYRMAISYLFSLLGEDILEKGLPFLNQIGRQEIDLLRKQIKNRINAPLTSSCGRLFDAVSALIGIRGIIDYEAQAAIEMEMLADKNETGDYAFSIDETGGISVVYFQDLFSAIINDINQDVAASIISARFHRTMTQVILQMCRRIAGQTGVNTVALSGGVFQNRLLLRLAVESLEKSGFSVLTHHDVPTNDGGVSLGQAVIASLSQERKS